MLQGVCNKVFTKSDPATMEELQKACNSEGRVKVLIGLPLADMELGIENEICAILDHRLYDIKLKPAGATVGNRAVVIGIGEIFIEGTVSDLMLVEVDANASEVVDVPNEKRAVRPQLFITGGGS